MKRYRIVLYKAYSATKLYTIYDQEAKLSETDQFFDRFKGDKDHIGDVHNIKSWIEQIGKRGALERYFRLEGKALAIPVPQPKSDLRLYCYRLSDKILILGNGGIKTSKKVKDSPDCYPHFQLMNKVANIVQLKLKQGKLQIQDKEIIGDNEFYIKEKKDE